MPLSALVEALLHPLGLLWLACLVAGLGALVKRRRGWGCFCLSLALGLHLVGGTNLACFLLARLERPYDVLTRPPLTGLGAQLTHVNDGDNRFFFPLTESNM